MVNSHTQDLLAALSALNKQLPNVCWALMRDELSGAKQIEFGELLGEVGAAMQRHGERTCVVVDSSADVPQRDSQGQSPHLGAAAPGSLRWPQENSHQAATDDATIPSEVVRIGRLRLTLPTTSY